jgi:hypothetical protein
MDMEVFDDMVEEQGNDRIARRKVDFFVSLLSVIAR